MRVNYRDHAHQPITKIAVKFAVKFLCPWALARGLFSRFAALKSVNVEMNASMSR